MDVTSDATDKTQRILELRSTERRHARDLLNYLNVEKLELDDEEALEELHDIRADVEDVLSRIEERLEDLSS